MPQLVLDPRSATAAVPRWTPPFPLPESVRSFGYMPNITDWLPGDILLVQALTQTSIQRAIQKTHTDIGFDPDHRVWTHAALYVGEGHVCEATPRRGVRHHPIFEYVGGHILRVRRRPGLSVDERYRLAIQAMTHLKTAYSFLDVLQIAWRARIDPNGPVPITAAPGVICSQLCSRAYTAVTGIVLTKRPTPFVTPADISGHPDLNDVALEWRKLP